MKGQEWDCETNIFPKIFQKAIADINPGIDTSDVARLLEDIKLLLDNEEGKMVYNSTMKREIPEAWEVKKLAELLHPDSLRKKLSTHLKIS